ncbi:MAG: hypothetical protein JNK82_02100 [Myxococcaceae bacterium]|nr:hypothetical protein [Myxococcaceae bacterium]
MTALFLSMMLTASEPSNGSMITTEYKIGTVTVELQARLVPCVKNRRCVQLPNGRRVIGRIEQSRFIVEETP